MKRARLLLVEDDASIRRYVGMALGELPLELVEAGTLVEARQALAGGGFALLLTYLMLPDGSAPGLLAELQARPARRGTPGSRVFSAGVSGEVRERAMALDAWRVFDTRLARRSAKPALTGRLDGLRPQRHEQGSGS